MTAQRSAYRRPWVAPLSGNVMENYNRASGVYNYSADNKHREPPCLTEREETGWLGMIDSWKAG